MDTDLACEVGFSQMYLTRNHALYSVIFWSFPMKNKVHETSNYVKTKLMLKQYGSLSRSPEVDDSFWSIWKASGGRVFFFSSVITAVIVEDWQPFCHCDKFHGQQCNETWRERRNVWHKYLQCKQCQSQTASHFCLCLCVSMWGFVCQLNRCYAGGCLQGINPRMNLGWEGKKIQQ